MDWQIAVLIAAIVCFVFAAIGVKAERVNISWLPIGLIFLTVYFWLALLGVGRG